MHFTLLIQILCWLQNWRHFAQTGAVSASINHSIIRNLSRRAKYIFWDFNSYKYGGYKAYKKGNNKIALCMDIGRMKWKCQFDFACRVHMDQCTTFWRWWRNVFANPLLEICSNMPICDLGSWWNSQMIFLNYKTVKYAYWLSIFSVSSVRFWWFPLKSFRAWGLHALRSISPNINS